MECTHLQKIQFPFSHKSAYSNLRPVPGLRRNLPSIAVNFDRDFFSIPTHDGEFNSICTYSLQFASSFSKNKVTYRKMRFRRINLFVFKIFTFFADRLLVLNSAKPGMRSKSSSSYVKKKSSLHFQKVNFFFFQKSTISQAAKVRAEAEAS